MWFMLITTLAALVFMIKGNLYDAMVPNYLLGGLSIVLFALAIAVVQQAFSALGKTTLDKKDA